MTFVVVDVMEAFVVFAVRVGVGEREVFRDNFSSSCVLFFLKVPFGFRFRVFRRFLCGIPRKRMVV